MPRQPRNYPQVFPPGATRGYAQFDLFEVACHGNLEINHTPSPQVFPPGATRG